MTWRNVPCKTSKSPYQRSRRTWIKARGPIPDGLFVCHHCDNAYCWEIQHLFLGTPKQNTQDSIAKGRFSYHTENLTHRGFTGGSAGENNWNAKLTEDDVRLIRSITARGSGRLFAKLFGLSTTMVSYIRRGKSWRHV